MKYLKYIAVTLFVLLSTYIITRWWLSTAPSERYWTWLNHQFGEQNIGLASDVELITVLLLALLVSVITAVVTVRLIKLFRQRKKR